MIFETKQNKNPQNHSSFEKTKQFLTERENMTWHSKPDCRWGHTNQEISKEWNPDLDTEASSFML